MMNVFAVSVPAVVFIVDVIGGVDVDVVVVNVVIL